MLGSGTGDFDERVCLVQCDLADLRTGDGRLSSDRAHEIAAPHPITFADVQEESCPRLLGRGWRWSGSRGSGCTGAAIDLLCSRQRLTRTSEESQRRGRDLSRVMIGQEWLDSRELCVHWLAPQQGRELVA
jgi:hypothetical protein